MNIYKQVLGYKNIAVNHIPNLGKSKTKLPKRRFTCVYKRDTRWIRDELEFVLIFSRIIKRANVKTTTFIPISGYLHVNLWIMNDEP